MESSFSLAQLGLSLAAGSLTTLSPCVFPLLPLVVGGAVQASPWSPVAMGAGMAASFALIGMALGALGPALGVDGDSVRLGGAWLLIAFAVVMLVPRFSARFTAWMTPIASSANAASLRLDGSSLAGALALGGVLGLVWSPCSGPLLGSTLTLVASEGGAAKGALALGLFGIGAAIPLVAAAYASRRGFAAARTCVLGHIGGIKAAFGVLIGTLGVAILTGTDKWLEARMVEILPAGWIALTTRF
ncbi:MAG: cytochrome c biogenesis CcdA family protein [Burkholderiales bacterium]